jgi:hypothetical protein
MKKNPIELIREEFCSRFGVDASQIKIEVRIDNLDSVEQADEIVSHYHIDKLPFVHEWNSKEHDVYWASVDNYHARFQVDAVTKKGVAKDDL